MSLNEEPVDYAAVLRSVAVRQHLGDRLGDAESDDDLLSDLIAEEARVVLTMEWDGGIAGGSGANYIAEWCGLYFFQSSDHDDDGPFTSVDEALELEHFRAPGMLRPQLSSDTLPLKLLLRVGRDLTEEGETISINGSVYVRNRRSLRAR